MSLPPIPGDRYVLTIRTFPEGHVQVQVAFLDDARELLLSQAALYAGQVTAFHAVISQRTEKAGRFTEHDIHWQADRDPRGLHTTVTDTVRRDIARQLLADLDADQRFQSDSVSSSPIVRAEWGWGAADDGCFITESPDLITLDDGTELHGFDDLPNVDMQDVVDHYFAEGIFCVRHDEHLVIRRSLDGAITCSGDSGFTDDHDEAAA